MSNLPAWASEAMKKAFVREDGWIYCDYRPDGGKEAVAFIHPNVPLLRVYSDGAVHSRGGVYVPPTMRESFQVAKMAVRTVALEGRADPRVQELEAEVLRLRQVLNAIAEIDYTRAATNMAAYHAVRIAKAALSLPEQEPAGGEDGS